MKLQDSETFVHQQYICVYELPAFAELSFDSAGIGFSSKSGN